MITAFAASLNISWARQSERPTDVPSRGTPGKVNSVRSFEPLLIDAPAVPTPAAQCLACRNGEHEMPLPIDVTSGERQGCDCPCHAK